MIPTWLERGPQYSLKKSLSILAISLFFVLFLYGSFYFFFRYFRSLQENKYRIQKIVIKKDKEELLSVPLLSELLHLSYDEPIPYTQFDERSAENYLLSLAVFEKVRIKKHKPDTLLVDFEYNKPLFISGDFTNTLVNDRGQYMAALPYFTPQKLPLLYGDPLKGSIFFKKIEPLIQKGEIILLDVSRIEEPSRAKCEAILKIKQGQATHLLRLYPDEVEREINNYFILLPRLSEKKESPIIIDLRLSDRAYMTKNQEF